MINFEALFNVSYGLYIVCSGDKNKGNGYISNSVFQVTAEPPQFAACCNKNNYTAELIQSNKAFSVSVLSKEAPSEIIGNFGYKSGRNADKMEGMKLTYGDTGVPVVLNDCIAYLECTVTFTIDVGTHLLFIGDLINAEIIDDTQDPMTYLYYRQARKGLAPKNAPTYIDKSKLVKKAVQPAFKKYQCPVCGYIYDEAVEGTKFVDLPDDWVCPVCGTAKSEFMEIS